MILIIFIIIIILWVIGGQWKGRIRDIPVPILMGLGIWLAIKNIWIGMLSCTCYNIMRLGYGNYEPLEPLKDQSFLARLTKDKQGWWIRAIYGFLVASIGTLPLIIWYYKT